MTKTCKNCGESFEAKKTGGRRKSFCDDVCKREYTLEYYSNYCKTDKWRKRRKELAS